MIDTLTILSTLSKDAQVKTLDAFPDIIQVESHRLSREDFDALLTEGLLQLLKIDAWGKIYELTTKAKELL